MPINTELAIQTTLQLDGVARRISNEVYANNSRGKSVVLYSKNTSVREYVMRRTYELFRKSVSRDNAHFLVAKTLEVSELFVANTFSVYAVSNTGLCEIDALSERAEWLVKDSNYYTLFITIELDDTEAPNAKDVAKAFAQYPVSWLNNAPSSLPNYIISTNSYSLSEEISIQLENIHFKTIDVDRYFIDNKYSIHYSAPNDEVDHFTALLFSVLKDEPELASIDVIKLLSNEKLEEHFVSLWNKSKRTLGMLARIILCAFSILPYHPYNVSADSASDIRKLLGEVGESYSTKIFTLTLDMLASEGWLYRRKGRNGKLTYIMDPIVANSIRKSIFDFPESYEPMLKAFIGWRASGTTKGCICNSFLSITSDTVLTRLGIGVETLNFERISAFEQVFLMCQTATMYLNRIDPKIKKGSNEANSNVARQRAVIAIVERAEYWVNKAENILDAVVFGDIDFCRALVECTKTEVALAKCILRSDDEQALDIVNAAAKNLLAKIESLHGDTFRLSVEQKRYHEWMLARLHYLSGRVGCFIAKGSIEYLYDKTEDGIHDLKQALKIYAKMERAGCRDSALSVATVTKDLARAYEDIGKPQIAMQFYKDSERMLLSLDDKICKVSAELKNLSKSEIELIISKNLCETLLKQAKIYENKGFKTQTRRLSLQAYNELISVSSHFKESSTELNRLKSECLSVSR